MFILIAVLSVISFVGSFFILDTMKESHQRDDLLRMCMDTYKMGFAALLGLIGGKTL